jgi:hypothetical protein
MTPANFGPGTGLIGSAWGRSPQRFFTVTVLDQQYKPTAIAARRTKYPGGQRLGPTTRSKEICVNTIPPPKA